MSNFQPFILHLGTYFLVSMYTYQILDNFPTHIISPLYLERRVQLENLIQVIKNHGDGIEYL